MLLELRTRSKRPPEILFSILQGDYFNKQQYFTIMASQMYSRYIPPKKLEASLSSDTFSKITAIAEPAATKQDASSTYTRYIPPPKSKHQSQNAEPKRKREIEVEFAEEQVSPKPKKHKKEDKIVAPDPPPIDAEDTSSTKKSKKRKRAADNRNGEELDQDDTKHKKLLEKREKALKKADKLARRAAKKETQEDLVPEEPSKLHDLVPLPQPDPVPEPPILDDTSTLPPWLASPIRIPPTATASFEDLGVRPDIAEVLHTKGFKNAFAVQAAVLPMLLPGISQQRGDILVSAATGSGKTLAYLLPIVDDISHNIATRLCGLIIMPTRELVSQAKEVCEVCAMAVSQGNGKRVRIGTAIGSENFKVEQGMLMEEETRYDPAQRKEQEQRLNARWDASDGGTDQDDDVLCDEEFISRLPDHVINHISKVDILICTPGRLVEHLKVTPGFTLEYIRWLVVDEADKLLDQTFQQWLDIVMTRLNRKSELPSKTQDDRVRKIILSATMTRDVGQLNGLKLHRPKLVALESSSQAQPNNEDSYVLPARLAEGGIKIDDESLKPLYLVELIEREHMTLHPRQDSDSGGEVLPTDSRILYYGMEAEIPHGVLIFTKSNESAVRLGRLLAILSPDSHHLIATLTSTTRSSTRKSTISSFNAGKLSILVASDLISRGIDLPNLAHVINYDMPTSVANYVHRVGRTARAGKKGFAWTLFTGSEGRWFWNEIARSGAIRRADGEKVSRVNIKAEQFDARRRDQYEAALAELEKETITPNLSSEKQKNHE